MNRFFPRQSRNGKLNELNSFGDFYIDQIHDEDSEIVLSPPVIQSADATSTTPTIIVHD